MGLQDLQSQIEAGQRRSPSSGGGPSRPSPGGGHWEDYPAQFDDIELSDSSPSSSRVSPAGFQPSKQPDEWWDQVVPVENLSLINQVRSSTTRVPDRIQGQIDRAGGRVQNRTVGDLIDDTINGGGTTGMQQALIDAGYIDSGDITYGVMDDETVRWISNVGRWAAQNNMGFYEVLMGRAAQVRQSAGGRGGGRRGGGGGRGGAITFENPEELKTLIRETATANAGSTEGLTDEILDAAIAARNAEIQGAAGGNTQARSPGLFAQQFIEEQMGADVTAEKWANVARGFMGFASAERFGA